ncbi:MAG: GxxExxY protein [Planctomycetes bacterium]|nr:GxxExxY protein [Planctomycetota bacterium]
MSFLHNCVPRQELGNKNDGFAKIWEYSCHKPVAKNMNESGIGKIIVNAVVAVHRESGPGLLEVVYEVILACEFKQCGISVDRQVFIPIVYHGIKFDEGFRCPPLAGAGGGRNT